MKEVIDMNGLAIIFGIVAFAFAYAYFSKPEKVELKIGDITFKSDDGRDPRDAESLSEDVHGYGVTYESGKKVFLIDMIQGWTMVATDPATHEISHILVTKSLGSGSGNGQIETIKKWRLGEPEDAIVIRTKAIFIRDVLRKELKKPSTS